MTRQDYFIGVRQFLVATVLLTAIGIMSACGGGSAPPTLVITTSELANGQAAVAYSASLGAAGGRAPYTWSITGGTLPSGLTLSPSTGMITGAPTESVTDSAVTFQVTDSGHPQQTQTANLTITVTPGTIRVSVTPVRGGLAATQTVPLSATVTNDNFAKGVTWTASGGSFSSSASASGAAVTYTAPAAAGVYTLTATSVSDVNESATATVGVTGLAGVYTYHNDLSRDGANLQEFALTPANVNPATFGKLFSCSADAAIYAQPLWVANATIGGGTHNVIVAATMRDSVFVFDADANPCITYWQSRLVPAGETYYGVSNAITKDIYPDIGILGTPVIDSATNTVYVVTKTMTTQGAFVVHQRLHALNLADGSERPNSPTEIDSSVSVPGNCDGGSTVTFNTRKENQRPGLALVNGIVYVAWASHGDQDPYHGWIIGFNASDLSRATIFNTSPNMAEGMGYCRAGIWMSGGAPAADSANNLYVITGNGIWDGVSAFGDSFLRLNTSAGLSVADWFTPANQLTLDAHDSDVGAGGAAMLVDQPFGPHPHLLIGASKSGVLYLLDRTNLGHFTAGGPDNVVQIITGTGSSFSTPAFWQNTLYFFGFNGFGKAYTFLTASDTFSTTLASATSISFSFPGSTPSVSSSGSSNGIVWVIDSRAFGTNNTAPSSAGPAILHAYDATNLAAELWNSTMSSSDTAGNAVKFTVPTVANGKVYVPTRGNDTTTGSGTVFGEIDVYGLKPD
ncbi:MAG: putative Ig domain-containing protein [Candidatus Acidiferrales bacterium]